MGKKIGKAQSKGMIEAQDFIDPDEGYRPGEPITRQPFFTLAYICESCSAPCESLHVADWDASIRVGECCQVEDDGIPSEPVCPGLYEMQMACETVGELMDASKAHRVACPICSSGIRKGAASELAGRDERKEAA